MRVFGFAVRGVLTAVSTYLGVITVAGAVARPRIWPVATTPTRSYSVLIPAHDEERLIATTVRSLRQLDYPADLVSVHVVADNCGDDTADVARAAGAEVHERTDKDRPGKGPALQWLFARLRGGGQLGEAIAIVDADTVVEPGFLRAVDRHLGAGAAVVQGHYAVRDQGETPAIAFRAAAMAARAFLRPLGRATIGGTAGLHGNGMVFRTGEFAESSWSDHLTEDVELHLDLLLAGRLVAFAPDARVAAEMPATVASSRSQHERWERGRIELARAYTPRLIQRAVAGGPVGRVAYLDAAMDLLVPPLSVVAAAGTAWAGYGAARSVLGRPGRCDLAVGLTTVTTLAVHVLTALRLTDAPSSTYRALLRAPRMVAWKLGLWLRVLVDPARVRWTRTQRNR